MSNIQKAIMFGVGILMTLVIIGWGNGFLGKGGNMIKVADSGLNDLTSTLSSSKYTEYDNTQVSGSQAINAIRLYASSSLTVIVETNASGSGTHYNSPTSYNVVDISDDDYIEPTAIFKATLGKTSNGTVDEINLEQQ